MKYKSKYKGSCCVYYTYKIAHVTFPGIIYGGTREQCEKYVEDYNRMSPEKYRCHLMVGQMSEIVERLTDLYNRYGMERENK